MQNAAVSMTPYTVNRKRNRYRDVVFSVEEEKQPTTSGGVLVLLCVCVCVCDIYLLSCVQMYACVYAFLCSFIKL